MPKIAVGFVALALTAGAASAQQPPAPVAAGDVARGRALYVQVGCHGCHGLVGQGAQATGPRLSRTPLPLPAFVQLVRRPLKQMPPYGAVVLPDQDVADLYAYLRQMPAPRDPKSIPLLGAERR